MATIFRTADAPHRPQVADFNLDDIAASAGQHLAAARAEAAKIVAEANAQADAIRRQAEETGRRAGEQELERRLAEQLAPARAAIEQAAADIERNRQTWLSHWESAAVRLAAAMAEKIIRREMRDQPDITLALVREALELAAGSPNVRLRLNPKDHQVLGSQVRTLIDAMSSLGDAEVASDATVAEGGCRVETRFGAIDQQIQSQLRRMIEELVGDQ